jgi:hypothetical protein
LQPQKVSASIAFERATTRTEPNPGYADWVRRFFDYRVERQAPRIRRDAQARRGSHLPVVLSMPETVALLGALGGTPWLMAALISARWPG